MQFSLKILKFLILALFTLFLLNIAVILVLQNDKASEHIALLTSRYLSKITKHQVQISGITLFYPMNLQVKEIYIGNKEGKDIARAENFRVSILPNFNLLILREITISDVGLDKITLFKIDEYPSSKGVQEKPIFLPNIFVKKIEISSLLLKPSITRQEEDLELRVSSRDLLYRHGNQKVSFDLAAEILGDKSVLANSRSEFVGSYDLASKKLDLQNLLLIMPMIHLKGKLNLDLMANQVSGYLNYSTNSLEKLIEDSKARALLSGSLSVKGSLESLEIDNHGEISFASPAKEFRLIPHIKLSSVITLKDGRLAGDMSLKQNEILGSFSFVWENNQLKIDKFNITAPSFTQIASLKFNATNKIIDGSSKLEVRSLKDLSKYLPLHLPASGIGGVEAVFGGDKNKQRLSIKGDFKHLDLLGTKVGLINFDINSADLWDYDFAKSNMTCGKIQSGDLLINNIDLVLASVSGVNRTTNFQGVLKVIRPYNTNLRATGAINRNNKSVSLRISELLGKVNQLEVRNENDISITLDGAVKCHSREGWNPIQNKQECQEFRAISIDTKKIIIGKGYADLKAKINKNNIESEMIVKNLSSRIAPFLLPSGFSNASISGGGNITGKLISPVVGMDFIIDQIALNQDIASLDLSLKANSSSFELDSKIRNSAKDQLASFSLALPIGFSLDPLRFELQKWSNFTSKVEIKKSFDLKGLMPLPYGHDLSGLVSGKILASGLLGSPKIDGALSIANGRYSFKEMGVKLQNFGASFKFNKDKIIMSEFAANDELGHKLLANGDFSFADKMPFNLNVTANKFNLISSSFLEGEINSNIKLSGDNKSGKLIGNIDFGPYAISIPEQFPHNILELNVAKIINEYDEVSGDIKKVESKQYNLALDVKLNSAKQVFVRGWGVDTMLQGNLHVTGNIQEPYIQGILKSVKGKYQEFGRSLKVKQGTITFDGPISKPPFLNIVGAAEEGNSEIRLVLSGPMMSPEIRIESTPSMSQEDALSLLLFGENKDISPVQALQLANSMRRLSGKADKGLDPLSKIREVLKLDNIDIKTDKKKSGAKGGTSASVGKYLTDKVYLEVQQGGGSSSQKTKIQVEVSPKISVESTRDDEDGNSVGVNWRFDYW